MKNPDTKIGQVDPFDNLKFFNFVQKFKNLQRKTSTNKCERKMGIENSPFLNTTMTIISGKNCLCMVKFVDKRIFAYAHSNSFEDTL